MSAVVSRLELRKDGPRRLQLSTVPRAGIRASSLHGLGVFALQDLKEGDLVEECPVLPFRHSLTDRLAESIAAAIAESFLESMDEGQQEEECVPVEEPVATQESKLQDYTFASPFVGEELSLLQLGSGCVFNHGRPPNVRAVRYESSPFVWAWVATKDVPEGTELLFDYGELYWHQREKQPE